MGLATEFLSKDVVTEFYGKDFDFYPGCQVFADSHRLGFPNGDWTDDTDQLILMLISLLETGGCADPRNFGQKLFRWKDHGFAALGDQGGGGLGRMTKTVLTHPMFLDDPIAAAREVWENSGRKMAANGAVMRSAVAGIPFFWDDVIVRGNTEAMCQVTHADPRCIASCVMVTSLVAEMLRLVASASGECPQEEVAGGAPRCVFRGGDVEELIARAASAAERCLETESEVS